MYILQLKKCIIYEVLKIFDGSHIWNSNKVNICSDDIA